MASLDILPNELIVKILKYLHSPLGHQRPLFSCAVLSRRWHYLTLPILWSCLHLENRQPTKECKKRIPYNVPDGSWQMSELSPWRSLWGRVVGPGKDINDLGVHPLQLHHMGAIIERNREGDIPEVRKPYLELVQEMTISLHQYPRVSCPAPNMEQAEILRSLFYGCHQLRRLDLSITLSQILGRDETGIFLQLSRHLVTMKHLERLRLNLISDTNLSWSFRADSNQKTKIFSTQWDSIEAMTAFYQCVTDLSIQISTSDDVFMDYVYGHLQSMPELQTFTLALDESLREVPCLCRSQKVWGRLGMRRSVTFPTLEEQLYIPRTLTKLYLVGYRGIGLTFPISQILRLLPNLEELAIEGVFPHPYLARFLEEVPENSFVIACNNLRRVHFEVGLLPGLIAAIAASCPLIQTFTFPPFVTDQDLISSAPYFRSLENVLFLGSDDLTHQGICSLDLIKSLKLIGLSNNVQKDFINKRIDLEKLIPHLHFRYNIIYQEELMEGMDCPCLKDVQDYLRRVAWNPLSSSNPSNREHQPQAIELVTQAQFLERVHLYWIEDEMGRYHRHSRCQNQWTPCV